MFLPCIHSYSNDLSRSLHSSERIHLYYISFPFSGTDVLLPTQYDLHIRLKAVMWAQGPRITSFGWNDAVKYWVTLCWQCVLHSKCNFVRKIFLTFCVVAFSIRFVCLLCERKIFGKSRARVCTDVFRLLIKHSHCYWWIQDCVKPFYRPSFYALKTHETSSA